MFDQGKFKAAMVAVVLVALLTAVGGLVISQAAGKSGVQAAVYDDVVRFTVQNEKVAILRAEVFDLGGKRLFDSGPVIGNAGPGNTNFEKRGGVIWGRV